MPTTVNAFGAHEAGKPLVPVTIERRDIGAHDVKLDILYCGICHSDMNYVDGTFGPLVVSPRARSRRPSGTDGMGAHPIHALARRERTRQHSPWPCW
ncbi:hypothetical protein [Streptomyces sp. NPDC059883]|uniref:hypothetical protein n=1 Tax=unclassified Streptomyces TaxID=2593676 RepID=UPI003660352C